MGANVSTYLSYIQLELKYKRWNDGSALASSNKISDRKDKNALNPLHLLWALGACGLQIMDWALG